MLNFYKFIASGFGSGYSPFAPGTAGSIVAFLISGLLFWFYPFDHTSFFSSNNIHILLAIIFLVLGVIASNRLESLWGHDSQKIVIDEMVGYWITILFIPISWTNLLLGLVLFRIFDIFKPWPIRKAEKWPKGWGVMGDDVVAGIFANFVLHVINYYL